MNESASKKILVDFGGRRKIFDRRNLFRDRNNQYRIAFERRSSEKRRSGFDRRGLFNNNLEWLKIERRRFFFISDRI